MAPPVVSGGPVGGAAIVAAPTLWGEAIASLWIAVPIAILFACAEWLHHVRRVEVEYTRKLTHLGSGVIVLSMPWVVSSHWTVLALCAGFGVVLVASKLLGLLPSIHAVERRTSGAQFYPVAVYGSYILSAGRPLLFVVPMLVMALSDTGAAVVGKRYGIVRYRVIEDYRSLGGSMTFFALTLGVVVVGLGLSGYPSLPSALVIALLTAMVATAVEGISVNGADNVLVPYVTWLMLAHTTALDRDALGEWVLGTAGILAALLATLNQARLNATGFMAAFVAAVLTFGLCGPLWLATSAVPYLGYAASRPISTSGNEGDLRVMVPGLIVSLGFVLGYAHLPNPLWFVPFLASVASISAVALAGFAWDRFGSHLIEALGAAVGVLGALIPTLVWRGETPVPVAVLVLTAAGALVGPVLTRLASSHRVSLPRARLVGVLGGTATAAAWAVVQGVG